MISTSNLNRTTKKADAEHPQYAPNPLRNSENIDRFAFACGEADDQPSLLPVHFSTGSSVCQGLFEEKSMESVCFFG